VIDSTEGIKTAKTIQVRKHEIKAHRTELRGDWTITLSLLDLEKNKL
jgi:hypothetical protein